MRDKTIASYCSPSGDICYGILNRGGHVVLQITTAAHYFNRYTLCVTRLPRSSSPEHAQRCGAVPVLRQRAGTWGSSVSYTRQYPVLPPDASRSCGSVWEGRSGRRSSSAGR
jgi:hypothetical protein